MSETTNLKLFKHNEPLETNENQFDVDLALNQNWDKIDDAYGNLNTDIENLQTNDNKQDELISKLKSAALNAETEESKSLYVTDANKFGQLEVFGNQEQETREGYNILDYLDYIVTSKNGLTIKKDEETGYVTIDGTPNADYTAILSKTINIKDFLEDKQTYTIFQENHSDDLDGKIYLQVTISDKDGSNPQYLNSSNRNRTFEVDKSLKQYNVKIQTGTIAQAGTFTNYKNRFMIYKGTDEKEFELYGATPSPEYPSPVICLGSNTDGSFKGSTEIKISNEAETEEISKILNIQQEMLKGDYFVKEADGWKEVHNFNKYTFTGTEDYIKSSISNDNYLRTYTRVNIISSSIMKMDGKMFATRYTNIGLYSSSTADNRIACRPQFHTQISTEFLTENTAEAYKSLLTQWNNEGNPLTVFYELVTPTKLPCTEEQSAVLEELSNLDLFEGVNNIITAEDIALLKLKYALDVETYVDNKIEEKLANINQQILEIVGGN